jgi:hypothetical protein
VRVFLQKALSPLELEGITSFGVVRGNDIDLDIGSVDLAAFAFSDEQEDVVSDFTGRKLLQIESVTFKDQNKWRVHDGQSAFFTAMDDLDFLAKVNAGERFGKGDVLVVDLQHIQTVANGTLRTEFRILKGPSASRAVAGRIDLGAAKKMPIDPMGISFHSLP